MPGVDMSTTGLSPSSGSELDEDHFFDAAPGVKRSNSTDTDQQDIEPIASTSKLTQDPEPVPRKYSPHKRIRTKAPAPPQGVKRTVPNRRLSDLHVQDQQVQQSDGDISLTRQPPPRKRQRGTARSKRVIRANSVPAIDDAPLLAPRRLRTKKNASKPRISASFNFTPETDLKAFGSNAAESLLEKVDESRQQGNELYRAGDYAAALEAYTRALDQYPTGAQDLPPPLSLLSNRAAAYIALAKWEDALRDMRKSFCYPCSDCEGNVKRLTRYVKCLLALHTLEGEEVEEALRHMQNQLADMTALGKGDTAAWREGRKAYGDLTQAKNLMNMINTAREAAQYETVLQHLQELIQIQKSSKREAPQDWWMMYTEALAWLGRTDEAQKMFDQKLAKTVLQDSPPSDWLQALLCCGRGEAGKTVYHLDKLRLATGELPRQASRLLHKAYNIKIHLDKAQEGCELQDWVKVNTNVSRVQQLADAPIMAEFVRQVSVYTQLILYRMGDNTKVVEHMMTGQWQYPTNPYLRLQGYGILAKALYHLSSYEEAAEVCAQAIEFLEEGSKTKSMRQELAGIQAILADIHQKQESEQESEIETMRKAGPHKILGLLPTATMAEIKKAYKLQSLAHHPDKPTGNTERFKLVNWAYQTLTTPPGTGRASRGNR